MLDVIETASEFYREMKKRGLHLRSGNGRDDALIEKICIMLGRSGTDLQYYLDSSSFTAEEFLRNFLTIIHPFSRMYDEIWSFLSKHLAPEVRENIAIRFRIPGSKDTDEINLEQFRRHVERLQKISNISHNLWPLEALDALFELRKVLRADIPFEQESTYNTINRYHPGQFFEIPLPIRQEHKFNQILFRIASLFQTIINEYAEVYQRKNQISILNKQLSETDYSLERAAYYLTDLLPTWYTYFEKSKLLKESTLDTALSFFNTKIHPLINQKEEEQMINVKEALDILDLPFWNHRWQTYEIWSTIFILQELSEYQPVLNIIEGYLPLDGYSTEVIADLKVHNYPKACVILKAQTPFKLGKRTAIKPDLRICYSDEILPETTAVIVEYKQHMNLGKKYLEEICSSYTNGSPKSTGTFIFNYDKSDPKANLPLNCILLSSMYPGNAKQRDKFRLILKQFLENAGFKPLPIEKVVLFDISGSMNDMYKDLNVQQSINHILDKNNIRALCFNDGLILESEGVSPYTPSGGTLLTKTLYQLETQYGLPVKLLIVTDGGHDKPKVQLNKIPHVKECLPGEIDQYLSWIASG